MPGLLTLCSWFLSRGLRTAGGSPYFTDILEIAFELYVLVTTANSPDVMYLRPYFVAVDLDGPSKLHLFESSCLLSLAGLKGNNRNFLLIRVHCKKS